MKHLLAFALLIFTTMTAHGEDAPNYIAETENLRLYCHARDHDCGVADDPAMARQARKMLENMEEAYVWLRDLGFPVEQSRLEREDSPPLNLSPRGKFLLRLDPRDKAKSACGAKIDGCTDISGDDFKIFIPKDNLSMAAEDPSLMTHEFVHTLQKVTSLRGSERFWMDEATATAIGTAFGTRHGYGIGLYEPMYSMSFDKPFYEVVDAGYGNWAYLLGVGQNLGSRDLVEYLARPEFFNIEADFFGESPSAAMKLLYDEKIVGNKLFHREFPKFVATINNIEKSSKEDSKYHYYTDIDRHTVEILSTDQPYSEVFKGSAHTYAVAPMLMQLELTPQPDAGARDTLMMAELEVIKGEPLDDLTLVTEHKRADARLSEKLMLNGSNAPEELGFVRVVNAPSQAQGDVKPNEFELRVSARPIEFGPPICFQAGEPATFDTNGFDPDEGNNWRLTTDNGTVNGVTITPARAGEMNVHLEIDSPITRADTGLAPVEPATTKVKLGRFDVMDEDCILVGNMTAHFTGAFAGSPNEIPFAEKATVRWQAVLNIETGSPETETDPIREKERLVYPDDGSEWMLSGSYLHERCAPGHPEICNYWTEEIFSGAGSIADGGGDLRIVSDDDVVRLEAKLPVTVTTTVHGPFPGEETRSRTHFWALTCYSPGRWWGFGPDMTHAGPPDGALEGSWASEDRKVVNFDCRQERQPEVYGPGSGESGSTSLSVEGRVEVQSR